MNVLVLAGTEDGRKLATEFQKLGHHVLISTLTGYGAELAESNGLSARYGALEETQLKGMLQERKMDALIDATHPYAENIHALARRVCLGEKVSYHRWERPEGKYPKHPLIYWAQNIEEAAQFAGNLGQRIFLSTGSKNLQQWMNCPGIQASEVFVRVLPTVEVIKQCEAIGLKPYQIIAAQGPFSLDFNQALWRQLKIEVVVTKESGKIGGTEDKVLACLELGIPVVILRRPMELQENGLSEDRASEDTSFEDFVRKVESRV